VGTAKFKFASSANADIHKLLYKRKREREIIALSGELYIYKREFSR